MKKKQSKSTYSSFLHAWQQLYNGRNPIHGEVQENNCMHCSERVTYRNKVGRSRSVKNMSSLQVGVRLYINRAGSRSSNFLTVVVKSMHFIQCFSVVQQHFATTTLYFGVVLHCLKHWGTCCLIQREGASIKITTSLLLPH